MAKPFNVGDRVRLLHLDGRLTEAYPIHDLWGDDEWARNVSFIFGGMEQSTHTDLLRHEDDTSPVVVPDGGTWFIARGNNLGWGRAQTEKQAIANMKKQGKASGYTVHRVSKWTIVDDMGSLSYPTGIAPVEVKRVGLKKK